VLYSRYPHIIGYRQAAACPRAAQKTWTYRSPRFQTAAALVPSAGTIALQIELRSDAGPQSLAWVRPRDALHGKGRGPIPGASPDVVLCADVVPVIDHRFDCCDLSQRGVIHQGTGKASPVIAWRSGLGLGARSKRALGCPIFHGLPWRSGSCSRTVAWPRPS
jgi:hypothetical protein